MTLVILGQVLELRARARTGDAIRRLLTLAPALRLDSDGEQREVPLDRIAEGDRLRGRPGEQVPTDVTVLDGATSIDESMVTGEPIPVERRAGDPVTGCTVNQAGAFTVRARKASRPCPLRYGNMCADALLRWGNKCAVDCCAPLTSEPASPDITAAARCVKDADARSPVATPFSHRGQRSRSLRKPLPRRWHGAPSPSGARSAPARFRRSSPETAREAARGTTYPRSFLARSCSHPRGILVR